MTAFVLFWIPALISRYGIVIHFRIHRFENRKQKTDILHTYIICTQNDGMSMQGWRGGVGAAVSWQEWIGEE